MLIVSAERGRERVLLMFVNAFPGPEPRTERFGLTLHEVPPDPTVNCAVETLLGGEEVLQWLLQGAVNDSRNVRILLLVPKARQGEARWGDFRAVVRRLIPRLDPKPAIPREFLTIDVNDPDADMEGARRDQREIEAAGRQA